MPHCAVLSARPHNLSILTPHDRIYPLSGWFGEDCDEISLFDGVDENSPGNCTQSHKVVFPGLILLFLLFAALGAKARHVQAAES